MNEERRRPLELRLSEPRKVRHGLKLKTGEGALRENPLALRWLEVMEGLIDAHTLAQGLAYARAGQTVSWAIAPGMIEGSVQGRAARPYASTWRLGTFSPEQWSAMISALAGEAMDVARLVGGQLPQSIDSIVGGMSLTLLPMAGELEVQCTCGAALPCKHAAALGYLAAERLASDPLSILTMRGMPAAKLIDRLQSARALLTQGVSTAHGEAMIPQRGAPPRPLELCLDDFWRPGPALAKLERDAPPQHVLHALLRRLGPSPLGGRFPLVGLLASIYDTVTKAAIHLRDEAERIEEPPRDEHSVI